ncbi:679_t:CDS:2 [Ambispora gerdemannii]|uniref:679_t:CDS:1 n=1 Tax=Ambispora gerdemannii TaxID=144530 RepID=A0A9N9A5B5_9GLOM|nr:679_t:CDS:2 [Ambispora gerdemannii]
MVSILKPFFFRMRLRRLTLIAQKTQWTTTSTETTKNVAVSKNNAITEKYAQKLKEKAEREGYASIDELKAKILKRHHRQTTPDLPAQVKSLDKILRMEKILSQDMETICQLWTEYHAAKIACISDTLSADAYKKLFKRGQEFPMFVIPLTHPTGLEFYILQFQYHQCFFTSLLEYKTFAAESQPLLVLTYYIDLMDTKGVVLMHGEIGKPNILSKENAKYLVRWLREFYLDGEDKCEDNKSKWNLVVKFNREPNNFEYSELVNVIKEEK